MEVMVGSSFGINMPAYVRDRSNVPAQDKAVPSALFLADESGHVGPQISLRVGSVSWEEESSSSIGESSDNEEEEKDDAVSFQGGGHDSFSSSLEDSLPIKKGLSDHYKGKSKSFGNLMEASNGNAMDLEKGENPLNKKRRLLIANKLRRRSLSSSDFFSWQNPNSMPLLAQHDADDLALKLLEKREMMGQTQSCFCLSSLQEEEEHDDDGGDE